MPNNDPFDPRDDSQLPIRLTARLQCAEKSSVFLEWRFGQILFCWLLRQTNGFEKHLPALGERPT
jgi:hypothetical protein